MMRDPSATTLGLADSFDQDPNKVLNGKGCQLTYRDFEAVQHSDENFGYGEPEATTHYERLITSKVTLRGVVSTFPAAGNPELHNIRDVVERPHRREKLVSSPACVLFLDSTMDQDREWLLLGRDQRAIMSNPPCLVLGRMHRVRHELHLRNDELFGCNFRKNNLYEVIFTKKYSLGFKPNDRPPRSLRSDRVIVPLGRYVATELSQARSLRSDRAIVPLGRYVATERSSRSRPSDRPAWSLRSDRARAKARSLRSDRAIVPLGRYVATELKPKLATGLEPKFGRCVAIEPFRTSIRHQSLHSRQTFECYLPKTVASSVHVSRYSNSSIKLRGLETAENS
ncbi:hypothetical protein IGI04_042368 [Brassica rapa subsp. trilocularis]|uniref:Uncharacterized protein n=1 Tax=Brassica rapa subsp. trilocularis TaxID=1813537 RepID=A0ABQ7KJL5_BRACM|nr:hypothetical protein IGI04_042368 [Brassica rapa subsp. trilocularis]